MLNGWPIADWQLWSGRLRGADIHSFGRRGEISSNRCEDHEISMLSLRLLQNQPGGTDAAEPV